MSLSNTAICIVGMHRSGTSCLTGNLEERGLVLGDVNNAARHNRKGNKENLSLRSLNDEILKLSGGAWDNPPEKIVWTDDLSKRRDAQLQHYAPYPIWGFKDPRTLLTLPFWLEAEQNIQFVGTFRHPALVARSLIVRKVWETRPVPDDQLLLCMNLWKRYNRELLELHSRNPFPLINFDMEQSAYLQRTEKIAIHFGLSDASEMLSFYDEKLRSTKTVNKNEWPVDEESLELYQALKSRLS